ncbi:NAD(P)/FAD-dependent oxidoreductase [Amycolatopsis acidicola]|uniref:NAD(P)/FAD-dependent oxidoreductase n=1 Tax=Amycolatopsis acidicola TaxID=2596893 RepID=A0A5N0UQF8_9PSEU|nr:NAD(P)/FAD-dependent oxidoreductase [Amycolatopsis acidicola]KAA9150408.1 NAD(P)/FAD-dependent oxidoreductase [Amycolatopsis acidicola]
MDENYDVVVVGGGAAGLSAAVALSRALRSVLVVDAGEPRNAPADGVHNYLGREGIAPAELAAAGRAELAGYGGQLVTGTVVSAAREGAWFDVRLADGGRTKARRLLVATGLVDELPDIPGLAERWGSTVLHCPYCHGWEVRGQAIGVLGGNELAVHKALLWRQWSPDTTLFLHTGPAPSDEDRKKLAKRGIAVVEGEVTAVEEGGIRLASGELVPCEALAVTPRFAARSELLSSLGLEPVDGLMGSAVPAEPGGATSVPGVWVAGNVTDLAATVMVSAAAGLQAAGMINMDLIEEEAR